MSLMHRESALPAGPLSADTLSLEAWLVRAGLAGQPTETLVDEFAARLCAEGIPLKRIYVGTATLHPLVRARGYTWLDGQGLLDNEAMLHREQIGRASGRGRVCQYVLIPVVAVALKKKKNKNYKTI